MAIRLLLNGRSRTVEVAPDTPLLWVLRDGLGLTGTKFGCGLGQCGACTVLVEGEPVRSCQTAAAAVAGKRVQTIEGLSPDGSHPLQRAWLEGEVSQCGYCQPAQLLTAAALLARHPHPTDREIEAAMGDVLCRCGTYQRIRRAIQRAAGRTGT